MLYSISRVIDLLSEGDENPDVVDLEHKIRAGTQWAAPVPQAQSKAADGMGYGLRTVLYDTVLLALHLVSSFLCDRRHGAMAELSMTMVATCI